MIIQEKRDLKNIIKQKQVEGNKVLVKRGVFDIIHPGHIYMLQEFKKQADVIVIIIMKDELVKERKGSKRPINNQKDRAKIVAELKGVDFVYLDTSENKNEYRDLIDYLEPNLIALISDHPQKTGDSNSSTAKDHGKIKTIFYKDKAKKGYSTTSIVEKIRSD